MVVVAVGTVVVVVVSSLGLCALLLYWRYLESSLSFSFVRWKLVCLVYAGYPDGRRSFDVVEVRLRFWERRAVALIGSRLNF